MIAGDRNDDDELRAEPPGPATELDGLRTRVDALEQALRREVRTRRLVILDRSGAERLVAHGADDHGYLALRSGASGPDGGAAGQGVIELFALDATDDGGFRVGVALGRNGDLVAVLELDRQGRPSLWVDGHDAGCTGES